MLNEIVQLQGKNYKRITKKTASRLYIKNEKLLIIPNLVRFNNSWIKPTSIDNSNNLTFDQQINNYAYYNLNTEIGTYIKFYIEC
jgi:hypothetical protein